MNGKKYEHQLTACLNRILRTAHDLQDIIVVMKHKEQQHDTSAQDASSVKDQKMEMLTVRLAHYQFLR